MFVLQHMFTCHLALILTGIFCYPVNASSWNSKMDYTSIGQARTFAKINRIQNALLPIMFKLGVIGVIILLTFLLAAKGVLISAIILMINISFIVGKIVAAFIELKHSSKWFPSSVIPPNVQNKNIHFHIYNNGEKWLPNQWVDDDYNYKSLFYDRINNDELTTPARDYSKLWQYMNIIKKNNKNKNLLYAVDHENNPGVENYSF